MTSSVSVLLIIKGTTRLQRLKTTQILTLTVSTLKLKIQTEEFRLTDWKCEEEELTVCLVCVWTHRFLLLSSSC